MIASHMSLCNQDSFILLVSSGYAVGQSDFADRPNITLVKGLMLTSVKARSDNNSQKLSIWPRPDGEHEPIPWHDM